MFDTKSSQKMGSDGFYWFFGVVEDINDPLQLGRMRVRVLGDHSQSKNLIPTEDLPWAYTINDIHSSSMQGIGNSPTGLNCLGSWVFGFYSDGMDKQQPVVIGSMGGIPESIPFKPKKADEEGDGSDQEMSAKTGFQDPNQEFPMGHHTFEQDTNRLARNIQGDHAIEIPKSIVPPQEIMIQEGLCPKKPVFAKKHYDKFDEAYIRKFGQDEGSKHSCNDTVIGASDCGSTALIVKDKEDQDCQFFLTNNNHPFTAYKFINRERFIPRAKVFTDFMHRDHWHEPDNPYGAQYPYNKVYEGYHKVGSNSVNNPKNTFVSEAYGYDQSITNYDGSKKEGIYRKQKCGVGSWGLGEEWDSTEGAQRYHRFHPSGNYFEIDNNGNEVRKIYGDKFEIDVSNRTILIKGDWDITVEGDKNQLIEGDYNLQVLGDKNTDIRGNISTHADGNNDWHFKGNNQMRIEGDEKVRISGSRDVCILVDDYVESLKAERIADDIIRKGGKSMLDEAFLKYEFKAHEAEISICTLDTQINEWTNVCEIINNDIKTLTEKIDTHEKDVDTLTEIIGTHTTEIGTLDETISIHNESITSYTGCIQDWLVETETFTVYYEDVMLMEQAPWICGVSGITPETPSAPVDVDVGMATYTETDGICKCLKKYYECIEVAKTKCITKLVDPRTLEEVERLDFDKYHASLSSCRRSYEKCLEKNKDKECGVCDPVEAEIEWECEPCHDDNCKEDDKTWEFYMCEDKCGRPAEETKIDPWEECEKDLP